MQLNINTLERNANDGGVITVHWTTTETSGEHTASQYGTESFTPDPAAPGFKPYAQLTEADVKAWLADRWGEEGMAAKQLALTNQLAALASPPVLTGLPWVA